MSAINEHTKEEFKRFFEYAFRYNPQYWQEIPAWEVLGKESAKTRQDAATINRLISSIVTSEQHLKRIISDHALDSAKELKYYAYLFLNDISKTEGLLRTFTNDEVEYNWFSTKGKTRATNEDVVWDSVAKVWRLELAQTAPQMTEGLEPKLPEAPVQFVGSYDNPNRLLEIVMNQSKLPELRQQALKRVKELVPWSQLPETVWDKAVFEQGKWDELVRTTDLYFSNTREILDDIKTCPSDIKHIPVLFQRNLVLSDANIEDLKKTIAACGVPLRHAFVAYERVGVEHATNMLTTIIEAQTRLLKQKFAVTFDFGIFIRNQREVFVYILNNFNHNDASYVYWTTKLKEKGINFTINSDNPGKEAFQRNFNKLVIAQEIAETVWQKYRKEQDEEYPALLAQYEKSLEPAKFPEHAVTETEDIGGDKRYVILKDKLGEAKANEFWNSHEKLLDAILGKFSIEFKNIFASRLFDISIIAPSEQNKIISGLGESHEYMFWGDSMNIQVIDPSAFNIVGKNELFAEDQDTKPDQDKANHTESEDL